MIKFKWHSISVLVFSFFLVTTILNITGCASSNKMVYSGGDNQDTEILNPNDFELYYNRGFSLAEEGDYVSAIENYNKALRINPNDAKVYYNRGLALYETDQPVESVADFDTVIQLEPTNASAYYNRGRAYDRFDNRDGTSNHDKVFFDYSSAIEIDHDYFDAYIKRGESYVIYGKNYDKGIADYNEALRIDPHSVTAYIGRGSAYRLKGDFDRAIDDLNIALQIEPYNIEAYNDRGLAYHGKGDFDKAIADFEL